MKNYLLKLKELISKQKAVYVPEVKTVVKELPNISEKPVDDIEKIKDIAKTLDLEFALHSLKKISIPNQGNCFQISGENMVFFYPPNDGYPTKPFKFFKKNSLSISNQQAYQEISNLDDILLQLVRLYSRALDQNIVLDPYYFMLRLDGEGDAWFNGPASLVITEKAIRNQKLNEENFDEANKFFINKFLDHFIGWNFGVSVNRNEKLKAELEALNDKVINMGLRDYAGTGYEVYGIDSVAEHGLQHYYLPTEKGQVIKHTKKGE